NGYPTASLPSHTLTLPHTTVQSLSLRSIHSPWRRCPRNGRLSCRYDGACGLDSLICKPLRALCSAVPSIVVTEKVIDKPYDDGSETEKPSQGCWARSWELLWRCWIFRLPTPLCEKLRAELPQRRLKLPGFPRVI